MTTTLQDFKVAGLPSTAFYIPDFISAAEEETLLTKIAYAPKPRWKVLSHRRVQAWPSDLSKDALLESPLPPWLTNPIIPRILALQIGLTIADEHIFTSSPHRVPNHVLVNEYLPGQGIMPHKDGEAYHPVVCTVSLGASICLDLYRNSETGLREIEPRWRIVQEPRSLLITTDELYTQYLHGIAEVKADIGLGPSTIANWSLLNSPERIVDGHNERQVRISLTYRDVIKVVKLGNKFAMFGKR